MRPQQNLASVQLWDIATSKPLRWLDGQRLRVAALQWAPARGCLASGSRDRCVLLHDMRAPEPAQQLRCHKGEFCGLRVRRCETLLSLTLHQPAVSRFQSVWAEHAC